MRILLAVVASVASIALIGGCVGGIDTPTDNPDPGGVGGGGSGPAAAEAKRLFETNVHPIVAAKCAGCHNSTAPQGNITGFVSAQVATAYATAVGYQAVVGDWTPTGAPILTKISGPNKTAPHQPIAYAEAETAKITEWLSKELEARGAGGGGGNPNESPGAATARLLAEWSGCMTLANFEAADMRAWGNVESQEGDCRTCHNQAEYGYVASNQSTPIFFAAITEDRYLMLQYFTVDLSLGVAQAKIIPNRRSFQGVGDNLPPHQAHPAFDPDNNEGVQALNAFYQSTLAAKNAAPNGVCGPSKLIN